jgi:cholesterol transport system auxiliary component
MNDGRALGRAIDSERRRLVRLGSIGVAGLLLGACVPALPGQGPAPTVYRLTPKTTFPPDLPRVAWGLAVAEPTAERQLDTSRIAVVRSGYEINYYADASWADRAPSMIQNLIVQSFRRSGAISPVGTDRDRIRADFLLRSTLQALQTNFRGDDPTSVRVVLDAALLTLPGRETVGTESFMAEAIPAAREMGAVIAAYDEALGKVLKALVTWTLERGTTARTGA